MNKENIESKEEIRFIGIANSDNGFVAFGSHSEKYTQKIGQRIVDNLLNKYFKDFIYFNIQNFPNEDYKVPDYYVESFKNPKEYSNWNLNQGFNANTISIVDWWSFISDVTRSRIMDDLFEKFINSKNFKNIKQKSDINPSISAFFPSIGGNGIDFILKNRIWKYLKSNNQDQLSNYSKKALNNGDMGRGFEKLFLKICEKSGIECYKKSQKAFKNKLPEIYETIKDIKGNFIGIPDFFVDKGNTHTLDSWISSSDSRIWEPEDQYAFVECKYNESPLSKKQKRMVQLLKREGVEVYVFRGQMNSYNFNSYPEV